MKRCEKVEEVVIELSNVSPNFSVKKSQNVDLCRENKLNDKDETLGKGDD